MRIMSNIYDNRIKSTNLYVETTFGEYLQYAKDLIKNNDLQRKRVKTSQTVYSSLSIFFNVLSSPLCNDK